MIRPPPRPSTLEDIPIENVQYVASCNWVDTEQPTIVVPGASFPSPLERYHAKLSDFTNAGSPAVWTGRSVPFTLQPDTDTHFIDQNGACMSQHPMLPLFVAANAIHNNNKAPVDWPSVDVIADRRGLRNLPTLAQPVGGKRSARFRSNRRRNHWG